MEMFDFLRQMMNTEDSKILFILVVICITMIIDFLIGTIAAIINKEIKFQSSVGINGILRKLASIIVLVLFIPVSILIPGGAGTALLYVLYLGYLVMELQSILENYKKLGNDTSLFEKFLSNFKKDNE